MQQKLSLGFNKLQLIPVASIPLSDGMCGVTTPLPIPLGTSTNDDSQWWKNIYSFEEVSNFCWADVIEKLRTKEKKSNDQLLVKVKKGIGNEETEDPINLRFTSTMPTEIRGKKLYRFTLGNDFTSDETFFIGFNVKSTQWLQINSSPYVIGRSEIRPMSVDVLTGKHKKMRVSAGIYDNDGIARSTNDIFHARSGVKLIDSSISLAYGEDQMILEEGVKLKGSNFVSFSPYTSDGEAAEIIPDGETDIIELPRKIKGGGKLLVQGFGEEDILKLSGDTFSHTQIKDNTDVLPEWLLFEDINYFSWMEQS